MCTGPLRPSLVSLAHTAGVLRRGCETKFTEALQHSYDFDAALLPNLPPRVELVAPSITRPLLVYTDAMFRPRKRKRRDCDDEPVNEWKAKFVSKLGIVLYDPHCDPSSDAYALNWSTAVARDT